MFCFVFVFLCGFDSMESFNIIVGRRLCIKAADSDSAGNRKSEENSGEKMQSIKNKPAMIHCWLPPLPNI